VTKRCARCGLTKSSSEFHRNSARYDGLSVYCGACMNERTREYAAAHPEKVKEREKRHKTRNPGAAAERQRRHRRLFPAEGTQQSLLERTLHPDRVRARKSVHYALKVGKLTRPDSCESCGRSANLTGHHHDYSKPLDVRWLCSSCHKKIHLEDKRWISA
jgi:ribosomal protein S27AE